MPQASLSRVAKAAAMATATIASQTSNAKKLLALSYTMESFREPAFAFPLTRTHAIESVPMENVAERGARHTEKITAAFMRLPYSR